MLIKLDDWTKCREHINRKRSHTKMVIGYGTHHFLLKTGFISLSKRKITGLKPFFAIMQKLCPAGYYHNGFMPSHALRHTIYGLYIIERWTFDDWTLCREQINRKRRHTKTVIGYETHHFLVKRRMKESII